jgi:hypothetical protein
MQLYPAAGKTVAIIANKLGVAPCSLKKMPAKRVEDPESPTKTRKFAFSYLPALSINSAISAVQPV